MAGKSKGKTKVKPEIANAFRIKVLETKVNYLISAHNGSYPDGIDERARKEAADMVASEHKTVDADDLLTLL